MRSSDDNLDWARRVLGQIRQREQLLLSAHKLGLNLPMSMTLEEIQAEIDWYLRSIDSAGS